jgi:phosphohistidine swiveling domain-containing protein
MSLWKRVFAAGTSPPPDLTPRLRALRVRRMNRAYRGFCEVLDDAIEKLGEEYILDRRYVVSVAEKAFHQAYEVLYHASVICPHCALAGLEHMDEARARIRTLQSREPRPPESRPVMRLTDVDEMTAVPVGAGVRRYARLRDRLALPVAGGLVVTAPGVGRLLAAPGRGDALTVAPGDIDTEVRGAISTLLAGSSSAVRVLLRIVSGDSDDLDLDGLDLVAECSPDAVLESLLSLLAETARARLPADRSPREVLSGGVLVVMALPPFEARGTLYTVDPDSPFSGRVRVEVESPQGGEVVWLSRRRGFAVAASRRAVNGESARPEMLSEAALRDLGRVALQVERVCGSSQEVEWVRTRGGQVIPVWSRPLPLPAGTEITPASLAEARARATVLLTGHGHVACPGMAFGRVAHVVNGGDLTALPDHAVLVAERLPLSAEVLRALPTVAAIVAEETRSGDPLAEVARRFRIPTLLGVEGARRLLPPGELVTVDAEDGTVYAGYLQELLHHHFFRRDAPPEEPEFRLLKATLQALGAPAAAAAGEATPYALVQRCLDDALRQAVAEAQEARKGDRSSGRLVVRRPGGTTEPPAEAPSSVGTALEGLQSEVSGAAAPEGLVVAEDESAVAFLSGPARVAVVEAFLAGDPVEDHVHLWWAGRGVPAAVSAPADVPDERAAAMGMTVVVGPEGGSAWREGLSPARGGQLLADVLRLVRDAVGKGPGGG